MSTTQQPTPMATASGSATVTSTASGSTDDNILKYYNNNFIPLFYRYKKDDYTLFEKKIVLSLLNKLYNSIIKHKSNLDETLKQNHNPTNIISANPVPKSSLTSPPQSTQVLYTLPPLIEPIADNVNNINIQKEQYRTIPKYDNNKNQSNLYCEKLLYLIGEMIRIISECDYNTFNIYMKRSNKYIKTILEPVIISLLNIKILKQDIFNLTTPSKINNNINNYTQFINNYVTLSDNLDKIGVLASKTKNIKLYNITYESKSINENYNVDKFIQQLLNINNITTLNKVNNIYIKKYDTFCKLMNLCKLINNKLDNSNYNLYNLLGDYIDNIIADKQDLDITSPNLNLIDIIIYILYNTYQNDDIKNSFNHTIFNFKTDFTDSLLKNQGISSSTQPVTQPENEINYVKQMLLSFAEIVRMYDSCHDFGTNSDCSRCYDLFIPIICISNMFNTIDINNFSLCFLNNISSLDDKNKEEEIVGVNRLANDNFSKNYKTNRISSISYDKENILTRYVLNKTQLSSDENIIFYVDMSQMAVSANCFSPFKMFIDEDNKCIGNSDKKYTDYEYNIYKIISSPDHGHKIISSPVHGHKFFTIYFEDFYIDNVYVKITYNIVYMNKIEPDFICFYHNIKNNKYSETFEIVYYLNAYNYYNYKPTTSVSLICKLLNIFLSVPSILNKTTTTGNININNQTTTGQITTTGNINIDNPSSAYTILKREFSDIIKNPELLKTTNIYSNILKNNYNYNDYIFIKQIANGEINNGKELIDIIFKYIYNMNLEKPLDINKIKLIYEYSKMVSDGSTEKSEDINDITKNIDISVLYKILLRFILSLKRSGDWGQGQIVKYLNLIQTPQSSAPSSSSSSSSPAPPAPAPPASSSSSAPPAPPAPEISPDNRKYIFYTNDSPCFMFSNFFLGIPVITENNKSQIMLIEEINIAIGVTSYNIDNNNLYYYNIKTSPEIFDKLEYTPADVIKPSKLNVKPKILLGGSGPTDDTIETIIDNINTIVKYKKELLIYFNLDNTFFDINIYLERLISNFQSEKEIYNNELFNIVKTYIIDSSLSIEDYKKYSGNGCFNLLIDILFINSENIEPIEIQNIRELLGKPETESTLLNELLELLKENIISFITKEKIINTDIMKTDDIKTDDIIYLEQIETKNKEKYINSFEKSLNLNLQEQVSNEDSMVVESQLNTTGTYSITEGEQPQTPIIKPQSSPPITPRELKKRKLNEINIDKKYLQKYLKYKSKYLDLQEEMKKLSLI